MGAEFELVGERRESKGRGVSRRLRRAQKVPAVLYGGDKAPLLLAFDHKLIAQKLEENPFFSHVLTLKVNGQKEQAVLHDVQRHPYKPQVLHLDFRRVKPEERP